MELVTPNAGTIFWMIIVFGVVLLILRKFAWKAILNALKEREESISTALNAADEAKKQMAELKAGNEKIIAEAKKERAGILSDAKDIKEKIVAEAKEKAVEEGRKAIEQARQQIESEKIAAIVEIKNQVAELSVTIAEKIIKKELENKEKQEKMINKMIDDIKLN